MASHHRLPKWADEGCHRRPEHSPRGEELSRGSSCPKREGHLRRGTELSVPPPRPFLCMGTAKSFREKDAAGGIAGMGPSLHTHSPGLCPPCHFCLPHSPSGVPMFSVPPARAHQLHPRAACMGRSPRPLWLRKAWSSGRGSACPADPQATITPSLQDPGCQA